MSIIRFYWGGASLLGRDYQQIYTLSDELSGGINQLLLQRQLIYANLLLSGERFEANNVECILLIGNIGALNPQERKAFDTYRNELRSVRIGLV